MCWLCRQPVQTAVHTNSGRARGRFMVKRALMLNRAKFLGRNLQNSSKNFVARGQGVTVRVIVSRPSSLAPRIITTSAL